jgi:hypothetical protein
MLLHKRGGVLRGQQPAQQFVRRVPVQLTPDVDDTIISVSTTWPGASPEEIEQSIVEKQEEKLQGVAGIRAMTISVDEVNSLSGMLQPGDRIDLLLSVRPPAAFKPPQMNQK